ncbi:hypothetical protein HELRODRAFT_188814 [Helobdella robusta]|uniref:Uncharacterized protein n=1 Tax=Helobdella robusta TaxID=6412 RepID=T1FQE2_HELRO|nr:hypothetical protein HELRODRAFT_188814 [Helobdella robusta]ESO02697.1 hypothetical protein HELRODRAFT_188814 [Helobdella robusta]
MGNKLDGVLLRQCQPHQQQHQQDRYDFRQQHQRQSLQQQQQQQPPSQKRSTFRRRRGKLSSCPDLLKENDLLSSADIGGRWKKYNDVWGGEGWSGGLKDDSLQNNSEYKAEYHNPDCDVPIKIYRSYTDIHGQSNHQTSDPPLKITVYRKSQESLNNVGRVQSVPRGMNRTDYSGSTDLSNSIESRLSIGTQEITRPPSRRSISRSSNATPSSTAVGGGAGRVVLNVEDFPPIELVKKKLTTFREFMSNFIVKHFSQMSLTDQMSSLCVAVMPDRANQSISLLSYLENRDMTRDLEVVDVNRLNFLPPYSFYPTLPAFLLVDINKLRREMNQSHDYSTQCQEMSSKIIAYLARHTADELARIYEYQVSLIQETIALRLLAKYVSNNIFEVLKSKNKLLDTNSMVAAGEFLWGKKGGNVGEYVAPKWISIICFSKEFKWNLYDIFKKCALRKDIYLDQTKIQPNTTVVGSSCNNRSPSPSSSSSPYYRARSTSSLTSSINNQSAERRSNDLECIGPWKFFACPDCEPMLYGYRNQSIEYDFVRRCYRLSNLEESYFNEELPWRYDDFHRVYSPYYRIISNIQLIEYCEWLHSFKNPSGHQEGRSGRYYGSELEHDCTSRISQISFDGLKEFLRQVKSGPHVREDLVIIYRDVLGYNFGAFSSSSSSGGNLKLEVSLLKQMLLNYSDPKYFSSTTRPHCRNDALDNINDNYAISLDAHQPTNFQQHVPQQPPQQQQQQIFHQPQNYLQQHYQHQMQQTTQPNLQQHQQQHQRPSDESLSRVLAQVTIGCDQLRSKLEDIDPKK